MLGLAGCGDDGPGRDRGTVVLDASQVPTPVGAGLRFRPAARRVVRSAPGCIPDGRGARAPVEVVHLELFAAGRVVVLPAGIGLARPWTVRHGRIERAACAGPVVTREPTGVVALRRRARGWTLGQLFAAAGLPLGPRRLGAFSGGPVRVAVDGRPVAGDPRRVRLRHHAQVVVQTGPRIPPHARYRFP